MTEFFLKNEMSVGDVNFEEFKEKAKILIESIPTRDIEKEICNIAHINLGIKSEELYEVLEKKWRSDEKLFGKAYRADSFFNKISGVGATKEDLIRLCFYLEIPFANSESSLKYNQRFNNVRNFMQNLMLQDGLSYREYTDVEEGLSYRRYEDVFWLYALKLEPNERPKYSDVKKCLIELEDKLIARLDSLTTFDETVDFYFNKDEVFRIYACLNRKKDVYFNKVRTEFLEKKFNCLDKNFCNKEKTYETLIKYANCFEGKSGEKKWDIPLDNMSKDDWFKLFVLARTKSITLSLKYNSEVNTTQIVEEKIERKMWNTLDDISKDLSIDNPDSINMVKLFAKNSLSIRKVVADRLKKLSEIYNYIDNKKNIVWVTLEGDLIELFEQLNEPIRKYYEAIKIDCNEVRYFTKLNSKGIRKAFILVTLLYKVMKDINEDNRRDAKYYYVYINEDLVHRGLSRLDPLNYFDALIIMLLEYKYIDLLFMIY